MQGIEIATGHYPAKDKPYTAIVAADRQVFIDLLNASKEHFFEITMPCGYSKKFKEYEDIPNEDLPCPCGQEGRFLIIYKKE